MPRPGVSCCVLALFAVVAVGGCSRDIPLEVTSEPLHPAPESPPTVARKETGQPKSDQKKLPSPVATGGEVSTPVLACGLPTYPGCRPKPYGDMSVTTGGKTITIKGFRTADPVLKVAQFYLDEAGGLGKAFDRHKVPMSQSAMTFPVLLRAGGKTYVQITRSEADTETEIKLTFFSDPLQTLD